MGITKEELIKWAKEHYWDTFENHRDLIIKHLESAFEPEYRECKLVKLAIPIGDAIYRTVQVDTVNWRLFDKPDSFFVVHEKGEVAYGFLKENSSMWRCDNRLLNWLKSQKKEK